MDNTYPCGKDLLVLDTAKRQGSNPRAVEHGRGLGIGSKGIADVVEHSAVHLDAKSRALGLKPVCLQSAWRVERHNMVMVR